MSIKEGSLDPDLRHELDHLHAQVCAALGDATRILILYALSEEPRHVTALATALDLSQPIVSRHLKVLRERGMVAAVREGQTVEYHLEDRRLIEALDLLRAFLRDSLARRAELARALMPRASRKEICP